MMSHFEEGSCLLIGQWVNLVEDLLKFLPRQLNFKKEIKKNKGYESTKGKLENPLTQAYLYVVTFA